MRLQPAKLRLQRKYLLATSQCAIQWHDDYYNYKKVTISAALQLEVVNPTDRLMTRRMYTSLPNFNQIGQCMADDLTNFPGLFSGGGATL